MEQRQRAKDRPWEDTQQEERAHSMEDRTRQERHQEGERRSDKSGTATAPIADGPEPASAALVRRTVASGIMAEWEHRDMEAGRSWR
eukprot:5152319-Heterocapsa_arctica.AAC.1